MSFYTELANLIKQILIFFHSHDNDYGRILKL